MDRVERVNLNRYLPHVLVATGLVTLLPVALVSELVSKGAVSSLWISALAGALLSIALGAAGNGVWRRYRGSKDVVFADLLVWGWLRRRRIEARLANAVGLLGVDKAFTSDERAETLQKLAASLESRDLYTHGHSQRVTRHAYMIAKTMGLPEPVLAKVRTAAALHDIGKLYTPREILHKPDRLTDEEFEVIKEHPVKGAEMAAAIEDGEIVAMIRHHHERLDGKGYPDKLGGDEIPIGARIIAVADTFDAITSARPYRTPRTHKAAIAILEKEAGSQLDRRVVEAFLAYYSGKRSLAWWASLTEAPQRLFGWLFGSLQGAAITATKAAAAAVAASVFLSPVTSLASEVTKVTSLKQGSASVSGNEPGTSGSESNPVSVSQEVSDPTSPAGPTDSGSSGSVAPIPPSPKPSPSPSESPTNSSVIGTPKPSPSPSPTHNDSTWQGTVTDGSGNLTGPSGGSATFTPPG